MFYLLTIQFTGKNHPVNAIGDGGCIGYGCLCRNMYFEFWGILFYIRYDTTVLDYYRISSGNANGHNMFQEIIKFVVLDQNIHGYIYPDVVSMAIFYNIRKI